MRNAPWSHEYVSFANVGNWIHATWLRFPRLCTAIARQACLSSGETAGVIRAAKEDHMPLSEACFHYTGGMDPETSTKDRAYKIIQDAIESRRLSRKAFGPLGKGKG